MNFTQYVNGFLLIFGCVIAFCNLQSTEDDDDNLNELMKCLSFHNYSSDGATDVLVNCLTKIEESRWITLCKKLQDENYPPVCWNEVIRDLPSECAGKQHLETIKVNLLISQLQNCIEKKYTKNYRRLMELQRSLNNYP